MSFWLIIPAGGGAGVRNSKFTGAGVEIAEFGHP